MIMRPDCAKSTPKGFTLVEIMIVVAIIALLAAIAVPSFLRARARAQATTILNDARLLDTAFQEHVIEAGKASSDSVAFSDLTPYLKSGSRVILNGGKDLYSRSYVVGPLASQGVTIDQQTKDDFPIDVVPASFWGGY